MKKGSNPFPTTGYYGPDYFCDREQETQKLIENAEGGLSTTLVAIRRIGKTGLIRHLQHCISKEWICIYIDILPSESLNDFLNYLATAIVSAVPEKSGFGTKVWKFIKSLRPVISYDTLSGEPNISFNLKSQECKFQLENLFSFLENQDKKILLAIDEFQQILEYPEKNCDAWLRKTIQQLRNVLLIFSGSRQHIMKDLFSNPSRPFFRSTMFMSLKKISNEKYSEFISRKFAESNKSLTKQTIDEILNWTNTHTYFVQLLCNRVFIQWNKETGNELWRSEALSLLKEQEYVFYGYRDMLTGQQWKLMKAVAKEGTVYFPTSKEFISAHDLGSSATVLRSLKSLQKKELLYYDYDENGHIYYSVYDILFQRWLGTI